jgi:hypothetical protein
VAQRTIADPAKHHTCPHEGPVVESWFPVFVLIPSIEQKIQVLARNNPVMLVWVLKIQVLPTNNPV